MRDRFMVIPLVGRTPTMVVNPSLVAGFFVSDPFGEPTPCDAPHARVAMLLAGCGDRCFFVDFPTCEAARAYMLLHGEDDNRT